MPFFQSGVGPFLDLTKRQDVSPFKPLFSILRVIGEILSSKFGLRMFQCIDFIRITNKAPPTNRKDRRQGERERES